MEIETSLGISSPNIPFPFPLTMADCGASGSALERVWGSSSSASTAETGYVAASLLGHAFLADVPASMPDAPPLYLSTTNHTHIPPHAVVSAPTVAHFNINKLNRLNRMIHPQNQMIQQQQQQQQNSIMVQQQMVQFQLQQYHMMQQQQQQIQIQQQIQQQETEEPEHVAAIRQHVQDWILSEEPTQAEHGEFQYNWDDDRVQPVTMEQLVHAWKDQDENQNQALGTYNFNELDHDTGQGATMEELAAAWAQAEADYDHENFTNPNDSPNLAAVYQTDESWMQQTYHFNSTINEEQRSTAQHQDFLEQGLQHFQQGQITMAIQALEISLQLYPNSAKAWLFLGKAHAEHDEDRKAIACLERAVETDPYSPDALLALGVSYVNELNHAKALHNLKEWITHNPNYAGISIEQDMYGGKLTTELDQVQALLVTALERDPIAPEIHEALGVVYNVSRDYAAAVASFQTALQSRPDSYSLWNKLGATLANSNKSPDALPAYHRALTLRPKYARAWLNMAISHSNLHNYDEAIRCYLQTLSLNPGATHCWSYVRIALSCLERWDLLPLVTEQNLKEFQQHFEFMLQD
jgi:peroxin-5